MTLSVDAARLLLHEIFPHQSDFTQTIAICGGGNGAHVATGYLAAKGNKVNVLTRNPEAWKKTIHITTNESSWNHRGDFSGQLNTVSKDPIDVIPQADVIIIAVPANAHPDVLQAIAPYIRQGAKLGALFGQGGFDWAVKKALGNKMTSLDMVFGLQNIPWICKATEYGHKARIIGPKKRLFVACYPVHRKQDAATLMTQLFDIPCSTVPNFLSLTLTPSNQIIHPARYYGIFHDWDGKRSYSKEELIARKGLTLYADMDEFSAEQMAMLDNELQQIKLALLQRFPSLDLSDVLPMGERIILHYEEDVADRSSLKQIFATNIGYAGCLTPLRLASDGGFLPAVDSRLFWEDIPYGLCILKNMTEMLGNFPTPRIDFFIRWHQQFMNVEFLSSNNQLNPKELHRTGTPMKYGIFTVEDLVSTSLPSSPTEIGKNSLQFERSRL